jgi:internalin A
MSFNILRRCCAIFAFMGASVAVADSGKCIEFADQCISPKDNFASFAVRDAEVDWSPLAQMPWLEKIEIAGSRENLPPLDLALLSEFDMLTDLMLANVQMSNADLLASVPLTSLFLLSTGMTEFSFLEPLDNLTELGVSDARLERVDLIPEAVLSRLTYFYLNGEGEGTIKSLQGLSQARELVKLIIEPGNNDLRGMGALPQLQELQLIGNSLQSMDGFVPGPGLRYVSAFAPNLEDISALAHAPNLEKLDISRSAIADISVLANARNLERLDISSTQVTDLSPLSGLESLETLRIEDTKISDFTPLLPLAGKLRLSVNRGKMLKGEELIHFIKENSP